MGFPGGSAGKGSTYNVGDLGLIPGLGRSPGEGNGYPLQHSGLENCAGSSGAPSIELFSPVNFLYIYIFLQSLYIYLPLYLPAISPCAIISSSVE